MHEQIQGAVFAVSISVVPRVGKLVVCEDCAFGKMLAGLYESLVNGVLMHKFVESAELVGDIPVRNFRSEALANFFDVDV